VDSGHGKVSVLQKAPLVIIVTTAVLCAGLVLASLCSREVQYCCHIHSHQIILMKSIVMLKLTSVSNYEVHRHSVELQAFKGPDDILGAGCVHQLLQVRMRWLRERPARRP
jgi:hypothetical protein